ncbi:MAG: DMP19 family protein [Cytophagales bacterium]|nr:DMP19 family protein [Cytophagales bacterium]
MTNKLVILLTLIGTFRFIGGHGQTDGQTPGPTTAELLKSVNDFMNRPIYKVLTIQLIDSITDNDLEQAVIDNIYEQVGDNYAKEFEHVQELTRGQQAMFSVWWVEAEVNNGGFNQFYFNSSGRYAQVAVDGFELFGATKFADLMRRANQVYKENKERLKKYDDGTLESFSESYKDNPLNALDEEFYALYNSEPLNALRVKYIRENPAEFIQK